MQWEEEINSHNQWEFNENHQIHEDVLLAEKLYKKLPTKDDKLKAALSYFPVVQLTMIPFKNQSEFVEFHFLRGMILGNSSIIIPVLLPFETILFIVILGISSFYAYAAFWGEKKVFPPLEKLISLFHH